MCLVDMSKYIHVRFTYILYISYMTLYPKFNKLTVRVMVCIDDNYNFHKCIIIIIIYYYTPKLFNWKHNTLI